MGTAGVPFNIPRDHIVQLIKKKKGVITQICKDLDICYHTFKKHVLSDPELKKLVAEGRNDYKQTICDMSENALMRALNQDQDLGISVKAAQYVLNNQGHHLGYNHPEAQKQVFTLVEVKEKLKDGKLVQS